MPLAGYSWATTNRSHPLGSTDVSCLGGLAAHSADAYIFGTGRFWFRDFGFTFRVVSAMLWTLKEL